MRSSQPPQVGARRSIRTLYRDETAATAVEFAIVALPFILVLLVIVQMGIIYIAQSALDIGVVRTGGTLLNSFYAGGTPNLMNGPALKASVASGAGGMISNDSTLAVEIRQLAALDPAVTPIADQTTDYGTTTSILVLRASAQAPTFAPGFSNMVVYSSIILRRRGT